MKKYKFSRLLIPLCALALSSCSDDSSDSGTAKSPEPTECTNACEPDAFECTDNGYRICQKVNSGCLEWKEAACPDGTVCNAEENICVGSETCTNACESDAFECTDDGYRICQMGDSGCLEWKNTQCSESTKCDVNIKDCADTGQPEDCHVCTTGQHRCDGMLIAQCEQDEVTGCTSWSVPESCGEGRYCDSGTNECMEGCMNECSEGETRCNGDKFQQCINNGSDCWMWGSSETCGTAQSCINGKCEYNCGSDCDPFSIVIIPDTQYYTGVRRKGKIDPPTYDKKGETIYHKQMQWIVDNKDTAIIPNLKMVVHMGDMTNDNEDVQWRIAKSAQDILKKNNIPFAIVTGDHDYRGKWDDTKNKVLPGGRAQTKFPEYFKEDYLNKLPGYGGIYNKVNTYFNFKAGNQDYMVLNLEFAPRQQTLCWANNLLNQSENKNKKVILVTHSNLTHGSSSSKTNDKGEYIYGDKPNPLMVQVGSKGQEIWDGFTSRHSNVIMALSGHTDDSERRIREGNNGNQVAEILTDYQFELPCEQNSLNKCKTVCEKDKCEPKDKKKPFHCGENPDGGNGWLRVLTFYPKENKVMSNVYTVIEGESLAKKTFSSAGTPTFFCSEGYVEGSYTSQSGRWYGSNPQSDDHTYRLNLDFTSKTVNQYNINNHLGFTHQTINQNSAGDQSHSSVAANDKGNIVFVWEDDSDDKDGVSHDIYGRVFQPGGCAQTGNIVINAETKGDQSEPDVAMDKDGNFVVVWTDDSDNNGSTEVWMRGFKPDGTERWGRKAVNTVPKNNQRDAHIAMAADGTFAVSWTDERASKDNPQIWVRGFNANGTERFAERPIVDGAFGKRIHSDIFMDDSKNIAVTWQDDKDGNDWFEIYMRLLSADGKDKTNVLKVNSDPNGQQLFPSIGGKRDGSGFIVSWADYPKDNSNASIKARKFDAAGQPLNKEIKVSKIIKEDQEEQYSQVCMDSKGNAVIAWYNPAKRDIMRSFWMNNKDISAEEPMNWPGNGSNVDSGHSNWDNDGHAYQPAAACISGTKSWAVYSYSDDWGNDSNHEIYGYSEQIR
ncbi:MAG: metallophosphoesterase [Proteobacteria bacterium]|nr:metallophosphoesterase [Pseudomonadota bacterium]